MLLYFPESHLLRTSIMAFSITSLLQTESLDQAAQSRQLFEETFRQYSRSFPAQVKDEPTMSYLRRCGLHAVNFAVDFVLETTDEKNLQATGYSITDQFYGERRNGLGILEAATKQRRQLREMRETMQEAQRLVESLVTPPPLLPPAERSIPEPVRQIIPSDSSSRSSVSGAGNGCFSATTSQPSTAASHAFSSGRRSLSPDPPPYHDVLPSNGNHSNDEDQDDDSNDDDYMTNSPNDEPKDAREWSYEALKHRGKGRYICPEWRSCTKGGNNGHGGPKIFKRNCMFRQHLQKHDKPHKCLKLGCPNKEGFARKDQLLRHQQNVKHSDEEVPAGSPYRLTRM